VLYYHYGSKEGILVAILEEGARRFQAALSSAVQTPGTARERLVTLCDTVFDLFNQNVPVVRVAHAVYFGPRECLPAFDFEKYSRAMTGAIGEVVEAGMAAGELRKAPVEDVVALINGVIGLYTDMELNPNTSGFGRAGIHRVLDLIFEGLLPTPAAKEN
jgi:AcrR family transcriptional regulator